MRIKDVIRGLAVVTTVAIGAPAGAQQWIAIGPSSCTGDGLAQFECGNNQTIPDCEVTCLGAAQCSDATCMPIYVEGPLGPTEEVVAYFYTPPVCGCASGWTWQDWLQNRLLHTSCLAEMFKRIDQHRSKVSKALAKCEIGTLAGRTTLPAGATCAEDDEGTARAIASSRQKAVTSITARCSATAMAEIYGTDGAEAAATFVDGLVRHAEVQAATAIGLALRPAVVAP